MKKLFTEMKKIMARRILGNIKAKMIPAEINLWPDGAPGATFPKPAILVKYVGGYEEFIVFCGTPECGEIQIDEGDTFAGGWNVENGEICWG